MKKSDVILIVLLAAGLGLLWWLFRRGGYARVRQHLGFLPELPGVGEEPGPAAYAGGTPGDTPESMAQNKSILQRFRASAVLDNVVSSNRALSPASSNPAAAFVASLRRRTGV